LDETKEQLQGVTQTLEMTAAALDVGVQRMEKAADLQLKVNKILFSMDKLYQNLVRNPLGKLIDAGENIAELFAAAQSEEESRGVMQEQLTELQSACGVDGSAAKVFKDSQLISLCMQGTEAKALALTDFDVDKLQTDIKNTIKTESNRVMEHATALQKKLAIAEKPSPDKPRTEFEQKALQYEPENLRRVIAPFQRNDFYRSFLKYWKWTENGKIIVHYEEDEIQRLKKLKADLTTEKQMFSETAKQAQERAHSLNAEVLALADKSVQAHESLQAARRELQEQRKNIQDQMELLRRFEKEMDEAGEAMQAAIDKLVENAKSGPSSLANLSDLLQILGIEAPELEASTNDERGAEAREIAPHTAIA
jgi:transcriptional regulator with GAF, ATPase, and Fis domain